ncbi:MAG: peptidylprolyl isomerase [Clostridia bacterium]|nr:peptidylprolyl isomerase [Clostridia bacterium]
MQKKSLLVLLLALTLILSGCALTRVNEEKDLARTIIDVNGETVDKRTFVTAVNNLWNQYQTYNQYYAQLGMEGEYPTDADTVIKNTADTYVSTLVVRQKAHEMGMYEFTEEEQAHVQEHAKEEYDSYVQQVISTFLSDSTLEGDELTAAAEAYMKEHGLSSMEDFVKDAENDVAIEKLEESITADVTVTDEEVTAALTEKADAAKTQYEENPDAYGKTVNNQGTVYYAPAGYRMVKQILVGVSEEESQAIKEARAALTAAENAVANAAEDADMDALNAAVTEAKEKLDAVKTPALAAVKEKADEVYGLATAEGADFDALIAEYNTDKGMPENGYAVREGFAPFLEEFTNAAMGLKTVGDVSEPVETDYGYHIIRYVADVEEGVQDTEAVRTSIRDGLLTTRKNEKSTETVKSWVDAANVKLYLDKVK